MAENVANCPTVAPLEKPNQRKHLVWSSNCLGLLDSLRRTAVFKQMPTRCEHPCLQMSTRKKNRHRKCGIKTRNADNAHACARTIANALRGVAQHQIALENAHTIFKAMSTNMHLGTGKCKHASHGIVRFPSREPQGHMLRATSTRASCSRRTNGRAGNQRGHCALYACMRATCDLILHPVTSP